MPVVTIRGQLGSGASEIGRLVADRLHIDYVDREIIAHVAELLRSPKQEIAEKEMPPGTLLERIAKALGRSYARGVGFEGSYTPTWGMPLDDNLYFVGLESVIKELASSQSIVIRGRGSQFILKDHPRAALHVLVVTPLEIRLNRVMKNLEMDEETAKKEIARSDSSRCAFIKRYFKAELEDPLYYDLVINMDHLDFDAAASIVLNALLLKDRPLGEATSTC